MTIETEMRTRLAADGAVSALVSTRIYPINLPQNPTYPAITFQRISGPRIHHLTSNSGRARMRVQYDCFADTYIEAQAVAAAIRASLNGFIGALTTIGSVCRLDNEFEDFEESVEKFRVVQDYVINYTE